MAGTAQRSSPPSLTVSFSLVCLFDEISSISICFRLTYFPPRSAVFLHLTRGAGAVHQHAGDQQPEAGDYRRLFWPRVKSCRAVFVPWCVLLLRSQSSIRGLSKQPEGSMPCPCIPTLPPMMTPFSRTNCSSRRTHPLPRTLSLSWALALSRTRQARQARVRTSQACRVRSKLGGVRSRRRSKNITWEKWP
jgi:hypothetical protein